MHYKLCTDPGAIMDMYFIFVLYFNQDSWESHFADTHADMIYYKNLMNECGHIDPCCSAFFRQKDHTMSFFSRMIAIRQFHHLGGSIQFSDILHALDNQDVPIFQMMWDFWTDTTPMPNNTNDIVQYISDSLICDDDTKQSLISYFSDPEPYENALRQAIVDKYDLVSTLRKKHEIDIQKHIDALHNDPDAFLQPAFNTIHCEQSPDTQYISFCLLHKKIIYIYQSPNIIILGSDYQITDNNIHENDLVSLASALCNSDRANIVRYIWEHGESSIHKISASLGIPLDATSYHLVVLDNAGIVLPRQTDDTTFYRFHDEISDGIIHDLI